MDFSKMNQRITFLENRTVIDEIGNHTSQWDEVYSCRPSSCDGTPSARTNPNSPRVCWASVTVKSSAETTNTGVTKEIQSLSFGVRQCAFLPSFIQRRHALGSNQSELASGVRCVNPTTHKILFRGSVYDIKSIAPDYLKNDYLTIVCETRKAGGDDDIY